MEIILTKRQLSDLELLMNGGFAPLDGFMRDDEYHSVVQTMRLPNGQLFPMPIVLDVKSVDEYEVGKEVVLVDPEKKPLAVLVVESIFKLNKELEAQMVYGTNSQQHFGVKYLFNHTYDYALGGRMRQIAEVHYDDFLHLRLTPDELKGWFAQHGWKSVVGFQTRNPIHRAHFELIKQAHLDTTHHVLIHPVVGSTKDGDIDYVTRVRCYEHVQEKYAKDFTKLSLLPLAMRMAGPREALWHALIRKNYGCTHFIVGRDHAGPGKLASGKSFYEPYEARNLAKHFEEELGIEILSFDEMVYSESKQAYISANSVIEVGDIKSVSGTELRQKLKSNEPIPEWFSFPEVMEELRKSRMRHTKGGIAVLFTGLPSSGKSTLARNLRVKLVEELGVPITILDGDVIRENLSKGLGFSKEDRETNIERVAFVASEIVKHGGIVLCAMIAPYEKSRAKFRTLVEEYGTLIEVYVNTPIEECMRRDVKGMYEKARRGEIKGFTGVDEVYEVPMVPDMLVDTKMSVDDCVDLLNKKVMDELNLS